MKKNIFKTDNKYLKIINKIENIRKKNNVNWMNILRLAFKKSPKEAAKMKKAQEELNVLQNFSFIYKFN